MSFSAKQCFNFSTLRERLSCCCFNPADAEQLEKGNKQLGDCHLLMLTFTKQDWPPVLRVREELRWEQEMLTQVVSFLTV